MVLGVLSLSSLFIRATPAHAWGLHYLVTDRAIEGYQFKQFLDETQVMTEPLEDFIQASANELAELFHGYYDYLAARKSKRFKVIPFQPNEASRLSFLRSARLNPNTPFFQVNRILPHQSRTRREVHYESLVLYEKSEPHFIYRFEDVSHTRVSARSVLVTYADEPDWWFDQDLWTIPEYGYGKVPYGDPTGNSSQAAFHMQFALETWLVRTFAHSVVEGMSLERMELFSRLAKLAFKLNHPYWGYRFTAWTMHYVQDLCQPYHSKAIPSGDFLFYLRFVVSGKETEQKIMKETTQLVSNRHFLVEDFQKTLIQKSYFGSGPDLGLGSSTGSGAASGGMNHEKQSFPDRLAGAVQNGLLVFSDLLQAPLDQLFGRVTSQAVQESLPLEYALIEAFGPKFTQDPTYKVKENPGYDSLSLIEGLSPGQIEPLLRETMVSMALTGTATRTLFQLLLPH